MLKITILIEGTSEIPQELSAEIVTDEEITVECAVEEWQASLTKYTTEWLGHPNTIVTLRYRELN